LAAKRRAREARQEDWRAARAAEEGAAGDAARAEARAALDARASRAVEAKGGRLVDDAATRRAMREERASAAAARRNISEARAHLGSLAVKHGGGRRPPVGSEFSTSPVPYQVDDPVLNRAKNLCSGASRIIAQLEEQDQMLRKQSGMSAQASARPAAPSKVPVSPALPPKLPGRPFGAAQEEALVARARELLSDYQPQRAGARAGSVPRSPRGHGNAMARETQSTPPSKGISRSPKGLRRPLPAGISVDIGSARR